MTNTIEYVIRQGSKVIDREKMRAWETRVQSTPNCYPDWTIVVLSLQAMKALREEKQFNEVAAIINKLSGNGKVIAGIMDIVSNFAVNGKKFTDYYQNNQKMT